MNPYLAYSAMIAAGLSKSEPDRACTGVEGERLRDERTSHVRHRCMKRWGFGRKIRDRAQRARRSSDRPLLQHGESRAVFERICHRLGEGQIF